MCAKKRTCIVAASAAVAITLFSAFTDVTESVAFQTMRGASQGSEEICAFSIEMQKKSFRVRYMQKVAQYQDGPAPRLSQVEEMYSNVQQVSYIFDEEPEPVFNAAGVDPLSRDCLGCHDGTRASDVSVTVKNDPMRRMRQNLKDHPIGMDYAAYQGASRDFKPIFGNSKMVLVDGKVGCLTCHDPLNQERGHLVMRDQRSSLCLTCHNK